jgi:hypothetical protein
MGDADAFAASAAKVLVAEGDKYVPVLKSDSARGLEARRGEAQELSKKQRLAASAPRFGMKLWLRLARHLRGIKVPHASANL